MRFLFIYFHKFIRFGLNGRTENERLKKLMKTNILADYNERNLEMIRNPVWRKDDRSKWMSKVNELNFLF